MSDIKRIGREANPAERTMQFAVESREGAVTMARNAFLTEIDDWSLDGAAKWDALSEQEKDLRVDDAIHRMRDHAAEYVEPEDPDDPDPGASRPNEAAA